MAIMIGSRCAYGPGGRDCPCCGQAPGKERKRAKRAAKRRERQGWKKDV